MIEGMSVKFEVKIKSVVHKSLNVIAIKLHLFVNENLY